MPDLHPFHLAFPVHDLEAARAFYVGVLGCTEGRSDVHWVDFNFFGHQIVAHRVASNTRMAGHQPVDGDDVPVPHFGVILDMQAWERLAQRLRDAGVDFIIEPHIRFRGQAGEQATLFLLDPSGNALEFKAFADMGRVFARAVSERLP